MPSVVVIAGPNGAGKSTSAPVLLQGPLQVTTFVNADVIARGLAGYAPDRAAIQAGRLMFEHLRQLARTGVDFAFETTLPSKSYASWLAELIKINYQFHLIFLWLPDADMAVARVQERVRLGGHDIPEETIRRRYDAGPRNFFRSIGR
jgi:predicted ABC-type ATPase